MTSYAHIRRSELAAMAPVGTRLINDEFEIIAHGSFYPGGIGTFPSLEIICAREGTDRSYSVHTLVGQCDQGGMSAPKITSLLLMNGLYDLTLDEAKHALDLR